ncbi:protein fem-1 homolog B isoform X3 [Sitodiplosis mosellana]|uniref:protein fem-1 homolog B isoform X3 n=1 Tax=Sitodiplosis mosellana TaxID=263140 RepID=UPI002444CB10|nr:protein fem-1 homolog B isoform X3 [Sitodiplosis mosellana]
MSRDVYYMVSSESDGRNDQQAASREPINNRQRDEANAGTANADHNENIETSTEERVRPFIKERVYYAAKDGLPIALTSLLSSVESETTKNAYINQIVEEDGQSFTPLVIAARNGRYKVVKTILNNFKPNIEQECVVKFDGHIVHGATALWCAAGSGHLNVIKLLIQYGANVNHKTKTHSTPLRAACFDGHLDIVKYLVAHSAEINLANVYNNTCLMISAYKGHTDVVEFLLSNGADPDQQALCGATALHYAAECGHVDICAALLDYGATLKRNEFDMTAVTTAAERTRELVVELFYGRPNLLTKEEKIDALELMGASFANDKDNYSLNKAYHYLLLAMELRYEDPQNVIRKKNITPVPAYENWIESQTVQDLQAIRFNHNSIHMESLTIRERILTTKCPDVAHPIVFRGAVCADNGRFDRCESLWLHALELRQNNNLSVQRDLLRFAQVFSQMVHVSVPLRIHNVLAVLAACIRELKVNKEKFLNPGPKDDVEIVMEEFEMNIITALYLCTILTKLMKMDSKITCEDRKKSGRLVYTLNKMNLKLRDGQTLLHLAVNGVMSVDDFHTSDVCRFPCIDTVRLLLDCGASTTVLDCGRNSPLHTLTATLSFRMPDPQVDIDTIREITDMFIEAGIHMDAVNVEGLTAAQICTSPFIQVLLRRYEFNEVSLRCLASRCIAQHKIPYKDIVPKQLEMFIEMHSSEKL